MLSMAIVNSIVFGFRLALSSRPFNDAYHLHLARTRRRE